LGAKAAVGLPLVHVNKCGTSADEHSRDPRLTGNVLPEGIPDAAKVNVRVLTVVKATVFDVEPGALRNGHLVATEGSRHGSIDGAPEDFENVPGPIFRIHLPQCYAVHCGEIFAG
jgi:hypothetical protein